MVRLYFLKTQFSAPKQKKVVFVNFVKRVSPHVIMHVAGDQENLMITINLVCILYLANVSGRGFNFLILFYKVLKKMRF